jgi:F-type H+-transporting ATPase subunit b
MDMQKYTGLKASLNFNRFYTIFVLTSGFCLFFYGTGIAVSSEGGGHGFAWKDLVWPLINFGVLAAILFFAGRKPVTQFFKKRTEVIEKSLEEAREARELATKTLEEVRERLANTDKEINEILSAAKKSGEKNKDSIIAEGEELKNKILEQAKTNIEFELQKARESIKSEAALMALELAEKQIKEKLGKEGQETLIDEYIRKLETTK